MAAVRRANGRLRGPLNDENALGSRVPGKTALAGTVKTGLASRTQAGAAKSTTVPILGVRKRAALGEVNTNANDANTSNAAKEKPSRAALGAGVRTRSSTSATTAEPTEEDVQPRPRLTRRTSGILSQNQPSALPLAIKTNIPRRTGTTAKPASRKAKAPVKPLEDDHHSRPSPENEPASKRPRVSAPEPVQVIVAPLRPKDDGWEDLDAGDEDDPMMVTTYVSEVYDYLKELEVATQPDPNYMLRQAELTWVMRRILVDWLVDVHGRFRLLPETIYLAAHIVDRFLSVRTVSLVKFQLVGVAALFIAAKYEEVVCPSVRNFLFMTDGGYEEEEILKAERYVLQMIGFDLSYPNPIHFLRRISKADGYDVQTRTVAKYFLEMTIVDEAFLSHLPSMTAAAAAWLARKVLCRDGTWDPNLIHYSTYTEEELLPTAQLMLDYVVRDIRAPVTDQQAPQFHKKYTVKKYFRASEYVKKWAEDQYSPHIRSKGGIDIRLEEWSRYPHLCP